MNQPGSDISRAILLTPSSPAAIAIVRLCGPLVAGFIEQHFSRSASGGRAVHGLLRDGQNIVDDPVIALFDKYADINLHGGPWVIRRVMELANRFGFEAIEGPAAPGVAAAMQTPDPIERAMLAWLPQATTELALRMLLTQPAAWRKFSSDLAAERLSPVERSGAIQEILEDRALYWLLNPPRVVIVGLANAGKSTLANQLFARQRCITADQPGTTRDWVGEMANIDGLPVLLLDTPGLRATDDPLEASAIVHSRAEIAAADLIILVLDLSRAAAAEQEDLLAQFPQALIVGNKADLAAAAWPEVPPTGSLHQKALIHTVALTGQGVNALRDEIRRHFLGSRSPVETRPHWWTDEQRGFLQNQLDLSSCGIH